MTDSEIEELAGKSLDKRIGEYGYINRQNCQQHYTDGFVDGYKKNYADWHYPAKGELPPGLVDVFVYYKHKKGFVNTTIGFYNIGWTIRNNDKDSDCTVIAWHYLPDVTQIEGE